MRHVRTTMCLLLVAVTGCSSARDPWAKSRPGQKRILTSFAPLHCLVANVVGDQANVLCLTTSEGPHHYRPTNADALKVAGSDIFIINGLELDDNFAKTLLKMSRRKVALVEVGERLDHKFLEHMNEDGHDHKDHGHKHGEHDPHIWLGLPQAQAMVQIIAKELGEHDPANKASYERNADAYVKQLQELEAYGKKRFAGKNDKSFLTMHESLAYFAKSFGLTIAGSIQPKVGQGIDAVQLARLTKVCKEKNVAAIAVEPQYPRGAAENLATDLKKDGRNIAIVEIDPIETAAPRDLADGNPSREHYVNRMKENIDKLAKALQ